MIRRTLAAFLGILLMLGMVTDSFALSFADSSGIDPSLAEDIELLTMLNIIKGDNRGNFNPDTPIRRSEAAKMIYVMRNKGVDDGAVQWKGLGVFSDVPAGAWYEGYVNYCYSYGIINGTAVGRFSPDAYITGLQLAKMLLVCSGYNASLEGLDSTGWDLKTTNLADLAGIFKGFSGLYTDVVTRQYACLMFSNCFESDYITYSGSVRTATGSSVGKKYFGLSYFTGILTGLGSADLNGIKEYPDGKISVTDESGAIRRLYYSADADLLGTEVTITYNSRSDEVFFLESTGRSQVWTAAMDDIKCGISASGETLNINGESLFFPAGSILEVYGGDLEKEVYISADSGAPISSAFDRGYDCSDVRFTDADGDGIPERAFVTDREYTIVTNIDMASGIFGAGSLYITESKDFARLNFLDTVSPGDVVSITAEYSGEEPEYSIRTADMVYAGRFIYTDGTEYVFSEGIFNVSANCVNDFDPKGFKTGTEYNLWTDGKHIVYATGAAEIAFRAPLTKNLCMVLNMGMETVLSPSGTGYTEVPKVKVLLAGGGIATYEYADVSDIPEALKPDFDTPSLYYFRVYEYTVKNGTIWFRSEITKPTDGSVLTVFSDPAYASYNKDTGVMMADGKPYLIADDAYFFAETYDEDGRPTARAVTDALFADFSGAVIHEICTEERDGIDTVIFCHLDMRASGGLIPEKPNYLLITSDVTYGYDADLGTYCLFSTALDSTGRIVDLKTEISGVRPRTGRLYTYITDTSGLTELTAFSYENASSMGGFRFDGIISSDDNSIITASAGKEYRITDSTRIWNLDNGTPVSSEKLEKAEELITGQLYRQNILMLTDPANEGEITDIFVEITGADIHYLVEMPERDHSDMLEWAEDPFEGSILTGDGRKVKLHFIRRTAGKLYLSVKNSEGELVYAGSRTADGENRSDALEWSGVNMTAWPFWTGMDDLNMMGSSKLKWEKEQISLGQNLEDIGSCSYTVILVDEYGIAHSITTGFVS